MLPQRHQASPIYAKLTHPRLRWLGHVERRAAEHVCKKIGSLKVDGKGKRGTPQKTSADRVKVDLEQMDIHWVCGHWRNI